GGDVDDAPPARGHHVRGCAAGHQERAVHVGDDDLSPDAGIGLPEFQRAGLWRAIEMDGPLSGIVYQDTERAEGRYRLGNGPLAVRYGGDIAGHAADAAGECLIELADCLRERCAIKLREHDARAGARETFRHGLAEPARGPGDDHHLSVEADI